MAKVIDDGFMLASVDYPFPASWNDRANWPMGWRCIYDDAWLSEPTRKVVFYFHGSGGSTTQPRDDAFIDDLYNAGYVVFLPMDFGHWTDPAVNCPTETIGAYSPFRFGYGSVTAPWYIARFCKSAWHVRSALEYFTANFPWTDITLCGHSMGAAAIIAWSAGYADQHDYPVQGIVSSGATVGGAGNYTWNDLNRNIATMTQAVHLIRHKALLIWADDDEFGPSDYARRVQQAIPPGAPTYVLSPGNGGHSWDSDPVKYAMFRDWVIQAATDSPILDRTGALAVSGPTA